MAKRIVAVRFIKTDNNLSDKEYCYFTDDDTIEVDDYCVVVVDADFRRGPVVVKVTSTRGISRGAKALASKWIVQKVDLAAYELRIKKQEVIAEIESKLEDILAQQNRYAIFQKYAESNPEIRELLEELKELDPDLLPRTEVKPEISE